MPGGIAFRRGAKWLLQARMDLKERIDGTRNPLFPPRRMNLPSQINSVATRQVELLKDPGGLRPDGRVLDIGCGPGKVAALLTTYLDPDAGGYEGFDVMPKVIHWGQRAITRKHPNFRFRVADLHNADYNPGGSQRASNFRFPYPDAHFDAAYAGSVFTHLQPFEIEHYLEEAARALRPGGRFLCTWFLLNEESEQLIAEGKARRPRFFGDTALVTFDYSFTDECGYRYRSNQPDVPEHRLLVYEEDVDGMLERANLNRVDAYYGGWCGRKHEPRSAGQDLLVLERPF